MFIPFFTSASKSFNILCLSVGGNVFASAPNFPSTITSTTSKLSNFFVVFLIASAISSNDFFSIGFNSYFIMLFPTGFNMIFFAAISS
jgi:hypothetical protein